MRRLDLARYEWVEKDHDLSWAMGVVTGRSLDDVIRAYGGNPDDQPMSMLFENAWVDDDELGVVSLVQVRQQGPHILMIENNGWLAKADGLAERASSDGGHFMAVYFNVENSPWISQARDGQLLARFDPYYIAVDPEDSWPPQLPPGDLYPEWLEETKMAWGSVRSTLLAIVEWQIGLAFDRAWLDEPMPTYRIAYPGAHASGSPSPMLA